MNPTNLIGTRMIPTPPTGLPGTASAAPVMTYESDSRSRYVVGAGLALSVIVAGCAEPHPAVIPHEADLPPNQGETFAVEERVDRREAEHNADQLLFWGIGAGGLVLGLVLGLVIGKFRWGRSK